MQHLIREPYRLFFPLGCLLALSGVGYWVCYSAHWIPIYPFDFHSAMQTQGFAHAFILGFLILESLAALGVCFLRVDF